MDVRCEVIDGRERMGVVRVPSFFPLFFSFGEGGKRGR
jgi:hypothetical protein